MGQVHNVLEETSRGCLPKHHGESEKETAAVKQTKTTIGHQDQTHCPNTDIERPLKKDFNHTIYCI